MVTTAAAEAAPPETGAPRSFRSRLRPMAVTVLVVLTSIGVLASTVAIFSARTVLNTDVFVRRVTSAVDHEDVQLAMATYLTDQVLTAIDADAIVADALPGSSEALAATLVSAVRGAVIDRVAQVLASDRFEELFADALRVTHEAAINLLEGDEVGPLEIRDGVVVLDLVPIVAEILTRLGADGLVERAAQLPAFGGDDPPSEHVQQLADALGVQLPADFGQVTVLKSESVPRLQDALLLVRRTVFAIVAVTLVLAAVALVLSRRRARTAAQLGIGTAAGMVLGLVVLRWVRGQIGDAIRDPQTRAAARSIAGDVIDSLRAVIILLLVFGVLVAIAGFIGGDSDSARKLRASAGTVARSSDTRAGLVGFVQAHADGVRVVAIGLGALLLFWLGLDLWGVLVAAIVAGGGCVAVSAIEAGSGTPGGARPATPSAGPA
jgi:hypothetical protein